MPNILHFIWFGSPLPEQYQQNIISYRTHNPHYRLQLWIDSLLLTPAEYWDIQLFCISNNIDLCDIRQESLINQDLIIAELDKSKQDKQYMARVHYVRASDLARVAILLAYGGIYNDTDNQCTSAIPILELPHGFLSQVTGVNEENFKENSQAILEVVYYHFMAAQPNNSILQLAADLSRIDYDTYHASRHLQWEASYDKETLMSGNVKLTGTSIKAALNNLLCTKKLTLTHLNELFIDAYPFSSSSFDKSWLQDIPSVNASEPDASLEAFCDEIEQNRLKYLIAMMRGLLPNAVELKRDPLPSLDYVNFLPLNLNSLSDSYRFKRAENSIEPIFSFPQQFTPIKFDVNYELPILKPIILPRLELLPFSYECRTEKLSLQMMIKQVAQDYIDYSQNHCQYSLFHRHHSAGRKRVTDWISTLENHSDLLSLRKATLLYLEDSAHGNTYPHSFRMMLVTHLLVNKHNREKSLSFDTLLHQLKTHWSSATLSPDDLSAAGYETLHRGANG